MEQTSVFINGYSRWDILTISSGKVIYDSIVVQLQSLDFSVLFTVVVSSVI